VKRRLVFKQRGNSKHPFAVETSARVQTENNDAARPDLDPLDMSLLFEVWFYENQLAKMLLCDGCRARAHAAGNLYGPDPEMCAYFKKGERALFESRPQVSGVAARE